MSARLILIPANANEDGFWLVKHAQESVLSITHFSRVLDALQSDELT